MANLTYLSEPAVLYNLKERYEEWHMKYVKRSKLNHLGQVFVATKHYFLNWIIILFFVGCLFFINFQTKISSFYLSSPGQIILFFSVPLSQFLKGKHMLVQCAELVKFTILNMSRFTSQKQLTTNGSHKKRLLTNPTDFSSHKWHALLHNVFFLLCFVKKRLREICIMGWNKLSRTFVGSYLQLIVEIFMSAYVQFLRKRWLGCEKTSAHPRV